MEPFVIKWGDFKCATEEGMVRQDPTGTEERYITMWTDPVFQGECSTATITKTIISQNAAANEINIAGDLDVDNNLNVDGNAVVDLQLTAGSANIKKIDLVYLCKKNQRVLENYYPVMVVS